MTKYEIRTDHFQFRFGTSKRTIPSMGAQEIFEENLNGDGNSRELVGSFDSLGDAKKAFDRFYASYGCTWAERGCPFWILRGDVAWIEESEYDEQGEFVQGGVTYDFSAEAYEAEADEADEEGEE